MPLRGVAASPQMQQTDHTAVVISSASPPWHILAVNECWVNLCEYSESEACGKSFGMLQGDDTDKERAARFAEKLRSENTADTVLVNYTKSGRAFRHHIHARHVRDAASGTSFYVTESQEEVNPEEPAFARISDLLCVAVILLSIVLSSLLHLTTSGTMWTVILPEEFYYGIFANLSAENDFLAARDLLRSVW